MDMQFPGASAIEVAEIYENGHVQDADDVLIQYYRERTDSIRNELVSLYPNRAGVLLKIFQAHGENNYDISVPLFLIQADGICTEIFGREFFRLNERKLLARVMQERQVDWVWRALAEPLQILHLPMTRHCEEPEAWNRHVILHGRSLEYGTEINGLKAISLLSFLHGLDSYAREKQPETI